MRSENGSVITKKDEVVNEFKNVFERMLNQWTQNDLVEHTILVELYLEEHTQEEIKQAINMIKNVKVSREYGIAVELLKKSRKSPSYQIKIEKIPSAWNMSLLCPIYKKGDAMDCWNYRRNSLHNTSYKVLSNVLLNRFKPYAIEIMW